MPENPGPPRGRTEDPQSGSIAANGKATPSFSSGASDRVGFTSNVDIAVSPPLGCICSLRRGRETRGPGRQNARRQEPGRRRSGVRASTTTKSAEERRPTRVSSPRTPRVVSLCPQPDKNTSTLPLFSLIWCLMCFLTTFNIKAPLPWSLRRVWDVGALHAARLPVQDLPESLHSGHRKRRLSCRHVRLEVLRPYVCSRANSLAAGPVPGVPRHRG